jgi:hypothetical protein
MTKIINFYGGPGTGKSTSAAYVFARLKMGGANAELVKETAKDWAWEERTIDPYSQFYLMGRQVRRESMLLGRVSHLVTDAPVMLFDYYASRYSPELLATAVRHTVAAYYAQLKADGHECVHVFLERSKGYNPAGRYQTVEEAMFIDQGVKVMLRDRGMNVLVIGTDTRSLDDLIECL